MATLDEILSDPKALEAIFRGLIGAGTAAAGVVQATTPQTTTVTRGAPAAASPLESEALGLSFGTLAGQLPSQGITRTGGGVLFQPTPEEQEATLGLNRANRSLLSRTGGGPYSVQGPADAMSTAALTRRPTVDRARLIGAIRTKMGGPISATAGQGSVLNLERGPDGVFAMPSTGGNFTGIPDFTGVPSSQVGAAPRVSTSTSGGGGFGSVLSTGTGVLGAGAGALQVAKALGWIGAGSPIPQAQVPALLKSIDAELSRWGYDPSAQLSPPSGFEQLVEPAREGTGAFSGSFPAGPNTSTYGIDSALGFSGSELGLPAGFPGFEATGSGAVPFGESALGIGGALTGLGIGGAFLGAGHLIAKLFGAGQRGAEWDKKAQGWIRAAEEESRTNPTGFTEKLGNFDQSVLMSRASQAPDATKITTHPYAFDTPLIMKYPDIAAIQRDLAVKAYQGTLTGNVIADAYGFDKERRGSLLAGIAQWKKGPNSPLSPVELWQLGNGLHGEEWSIPRLLIDWEKVNEANRRQQELDEARR